MNQKRIIFLSSVIIGVLTLTLGVTFAVFTFNKTSTNSKLIVGDIYMHYNETNQITLENAMPSDTYNSTNYFEFTVDGKNTTTNKDIWYEIVLSYGDNHPTRTTRIRDDLLKFRLVEAKDGVETTVVDNKSYSDLNNHRVWVDTINKNTTTEVTHTYRLYMWISNDTIIGNVNQDYTMEEWNDVFASIKVNVTGDFNEKELSYEDIYNVTDASCFTTTTNQDNTITITDYDASCGTDVVIPKTINGNSVTTIGDYAFALNQLTSVVIPNSVTTIGDAAFGANQLASVVIPDSVTTIGDDVFIANQLTSVTIGSNVTTIGNGAFADNQLTGVTIPDSVTTIGSSAFKSNQLTSVVIPDSVTTIGDIVFNDNLLPDNQAFIYARTDNNSDGIAEIDSTTIVSYGGGNKQPIIPDSVTTIGNGAFQSNQLTSVTIPDSVTTIGEDAFYGNQLTSVVIGNSVTTIESSAFQSNQLTSVTIGNSVTTIEYSAFIDNQLTSVEIPNSVTYLSCSAFDDTVTITKNEDLTCDDRQ